MPGQLVTIARYRDLSEAWLYQSKLDSAGIPAFLRDEQVITFWWYYSNALGGIRLEVHPSDAEEALKIITTDVPKEFEYETPSGLKQFSQPACVKCGSLNIEHFHENRAISVALIFSVNIPYPLGGGQWHCLTCDTRWEVVDESEPNEEECASPAAPDPDKPLIIYVATTNKGKLREFKEIAFPFDVKVFPANQDRDMPEVEEDGDTFEANAAKKAIEYSRHLPGQLVIADDSGLEVAVLNGAPGVYSARYAARNENHRPTDADNNYKLLATLEDMKAQHRTARFVCVISAARDGELLASFRGEAQGEILMSPLGGRGFGYDPLFYVKEAHKTFGEMGSEEKARHSHRGAAFRKFLDWATASPR